MPKLKPDHHFANTLKKTPPSAPPSPKTPTPSKLDEEWFREARAVQRGLFRSFGRQWYGNGQQSDESPQASENGAPS